MNELKWSDDCLVGIPAVDWQHKGIFDCFVTIVAEALNKHDCFLTDFSYVRLVKLLQQHFALEESMMRSFDYPELALHIEEHRQFHADVHCAAQTFLEGNGGAPRELVKVVKTWQSEHLMKSDRRYVEHFAGASNAERRRKS